MTPEDLVILPPRPYSRSDQHSTLSPSSSLSPGRRAMEMGGMGGCGGVAGGSVGDSTSSSPSGSTCSSMTTIPSRPQSVDPSELYLNKRRQSMVRHAPSPAQMSNGIIAPFPRKTTFRSPLLQARVLKLSANNTATTATLSTNSLAKSLEQSVQRMSIANNSGCRVDARLPLSPASSYDAEEDARDELMHIFHPRPSFFRPVALPSMPSMFTMDEEDGCGGGGVSEHKPIQRRSSPRTVTTRAGAAAASNNNRNSHDHNHNHDPNDQAGSDESAFVIGTCLLMEEEMLMKMSSADELSLEPRRSPTPLDAAMIASTMTAGDKQHDVSRSGGGSGGGSGSDSSSSPKGIDLRLRMHHLPSSKDWMSSTRAPFLDDDVDGAEAMNGGCGDIGVGVGMGMGMGGIASSPIARALNPLAMMSRRSSLLVTSGSITRGDLREHQQDPKSSKVEAHAGDKREE